MDRQEPLPEPTAAELAKEAEQEAAVFSQAANVDRLLTMLRQMDPAKDNLADNDEIQVYLLASIFFTHYLLAGLGTLPLMHESASQDCEVDRQVQPEAR